MGLRIDMQTKARKRFIQPIVSVISLLSIWGLSFAAPAPSKQELEAIKLKIESLKSELNASQSAHKEAADELKQSETAISEANRKLYELQSKHQQSETQLKQLSKKKSTLESNVDAQKNLLGAQLYRQYIVGRPSFLQVALQQENANDIARELHYFSYIAKSRAESIQSLQQNIQHVAALNQETASALTEISSLKSQQEQEKHALELQKQERDKVLKTLASKIAAQRNEIDKLKRDEKQLSTLFEKLAKLAKKKSKTKVIKKKTIPTKSTKQSPDSTSEETVPQQESEVAQNDALPSESSSGGHFSSLKGKLRLPVRGSVSNRFGTPRQETGVTWKGLFIKASEGSEVKSIASGTVVFADWMRGFGNLLIVDHGGGYMSLYGNNQSLLKQAGENVNAGDTIAAVGNTGGNASAGLYYELRKHSRPFDPMSWSSLR